MKLSLQICLFLLFSLGAFCQDVSIPFREGNAFGISDYQGKLLTKNRYDYIDYQRKMPKGYFYFSEKGNKGILYNGKPVVSGAEYDEFGIEPHKFIIATLRENSNTSKTYKDEKEYHYYKKRRTGQAIFNLKGENLYPDNFKYIRPIDTVGISAINKKRARYALIAVTDFDDAYSLFVYDCDKQKISEWLLKDYYKVTLDRSLSLPGRSIYLTASRQRSDAKEPMKIINDNGKFTLQKVPVKQEDDRQEVYEGSGYGSGTGRGSGDVKVMDGGDVPEPYTYVKADGGSVTPTPKKIKKYSTNSFEIKDGKLFLSERIAGQKEASPAIEFQMPASDKPYAFESISYGGVIEDTEEKRVNLKNIILYKSGDHYGIILSKEQTIPSRYESITPLAFDVAGNRTLLFIVGQKDVNTPQIKYGLIDKTEKVIIPILYDELDPFALSKYATKEFNVYIKYWRVKKDGKYGVITPFDGMVLPVSYDEIEANKTNYLRHDDDFISLKKDGLYGFVADWDFTAEKIIQPVFPYKVGFYDRNYQKEKRLLLLGLVNNEGKFFCYARKDGFLYYKEK